MGQARRLLLNAELVVLNGNPNVYYQPPQDRVMNYPCIVYERDDDEVKHADNIPYSVMQRYQVTVIDHDPDSVVVDKLRMRPYCRFVRHFATSGLNHDVFELYH